MDADDVQKMNSELLFQINKDFPTLDKVVEFIKNGADVNLTNDIGETILIKFCKSDIDIEIDEAVDTLIGLGANVNASESCDITALIGCSWRGRAEIVKRLLKVNGIEINAVDGEGNTALMLASSNSIECTKLLLDAGADINIPDINGNTVLSEARSHTSLTFYDEVSSTDINMLSFLEDYIEKTEKKSSQERADEVFFVLTGVFGR